MRRMMWIGLLAASAAVLAAEDDLPPPPLAPGVVAPAGAADAPPSPTPGAAPVEAPTAAPAEDVEPGLSVVPQPGEGAAGEPEVTIRQRGKETVEEYAIQGRVYKVRVRPVVGPAYYLVDTDGDGNFETRQNDLKAPVPVPQWVLYRW